MSVQGSKSELILIDSHVKMKLYSRNKPGTLQRSLRVRDAVAVWTLQMNLLWNQKLLLMRCQRCCSPRSAAWRARCVFAAQTTERQTRVSGRRPKSVFAIWKYHEKKAQKHKLERKKKESLAKWNWYLCIYLHEHIQSVAHDRWHLDAPNQTLEELLRRVWFMLKLVFRTSGTLAQVGCLIWLWFVRTCECGPV